MPETVRDRRYIKSMPADDPRAIRSATTPFQASRLVPLAVVVVVAVAVVAMGWHRELSLENLVRYRAALDAFVAAHGAGAVAAFVAVYVVVVALSIPGALFLTVSSGILFGTLTGALASVIGATLGATIIFLVARTAFGEHLVRRAGPAVARLAEGFREDALSYMLFLRIVPFPFFVINLVAAVAGIGLAPFVVGTAVGIVPAAFALAFLGAGIDSAVMAQEASYRACIAAGGGTCTLDFNLKTAVTPELIGALVALGCAALLPVLVKRLRARRAAGPSS
jgi:uncharacterized membrane protein YdjX (TVP38/TMEM64 family)